MPYLELDDRQALLPQLADYIQQLDVPPCDVLCILPNDFLSQPLRQALRQGRASFVPHITTLRELLAQQATAYQVLPPHQCSLLLAQLLKAHRHLYGKSSPWSLASNLLSLFDELTLQGLEHDISWEAFKARLSQGDEHSGQQHPWFNREAEIVFTLWRAWQEQMRSEGWRDQASAYVDKLQGRSGFAPGREDNADSLQQPLLSAAAHCVFVHPNLLRQCERDWLERLKQQRPVSEVGYRSAAGSDSRIHTAPCQSAEEQAMLVCLAAKQAVEQGHRPLIVGDDRRLTRRIRALLARFAISVDDKAGWTLSTTQMGACLEYWLQCIENNFAYQSLLDFLKSPFALSELDNKTELVFHLEQDIIHRENIASELSNYRRALHSRQQRLGAAGSATQQQLEQLLEQLGEAAQGLQALQRSRKKHSPVVLLHAFRQSLQQLGVLAPLQQDAAGQQAIRLLDELEHAHTDSMSELQLSWQDFRQWFNQALESSYFRPGVQHAQVLLLNYQQAYFADADYRILYSADVNHLPPSPPRSPFFNQQTRAGLGLETRQSFQQRHQQIFQRLCNAPGQCLISWQCQNEGEPMEASRWVQLLMQTRATCEQRELLQQVRQAITASAQARPYQAARVAAATLCKPSYSASAHQRLITCPYHYFAADLLGLQPVDEIRQALEKSDYGKRVHRCLEAFHHDLAHLPGPFPDTLNNGNRQAAQTLLEAIGSAVFSRDTQHSFEHRSWLKRWNRLIPNYIDWEIKRQQSYRAEQFEQDVDFPLNQQLRVRGRIDRRDRHRETGSGSLLDYKTGYTPSADDMRSGEDVQLSTYAFTLEHITQCAYITLQSDTPIHERNSLQDEDLQAVSDAVKARLLHLQEQIQANQMLPAWGEQAACERCHNAGICRRSLWSEGGA
ncbi:MAG: hypothetical protein CSA54_00030 [Gammaproteobacteria bacterium]|nr:MAG: hypothetical protein CSA54_00030 [Gammaproteobacteria bacterium]